MKNKLPKNSLKDLIINNPRAQDRLDIKEIEKKVRKVKRSKFVKEIGSGYSLWFI